jgi:hypothetical protein
MAQKFGRKRITAKIASPELIKTDQKPHHFPAGMKRDEYDLIEGTDN